MVVDIPTHDGIVGCICNLIIVQCSGSPIRHLNRPLLTRLASCLRKNKGRGEEGRGEERGGGGG